MTPPGYHMDQEIRSQPAMFAALLSDAGWADDLSRHLVRRQPRFVLFAARGTSDHAALYGKYLAEVELGLPAGLVSPSTATVYRAAARMDGVLFVAVSQSGASPDLVHALTAARNGGATTVALTNDAGSALAQAAEFSVDLRAGEEIAVAATKTYTAELLALYLMFTALSATRDNEGLSQVHEAAERTLIESERIDEAAQRYRDATHLVVTARGYSSPTAGEAALKLIETCRLPALAYSAADLLHGPLAIVDVGTPVMAVVTAGAASDAMRPVLDRLTELQADVLLVGPLAGLPVYTDGITEPLHPILQILPLQQLALRLALARGHDPDRPRNLSKVTRTR